MFGVSLPELIVIFVVVLVIFGPDKLPEIARSLGKWTGDLRRTSDSLRREFYHSVYNPIDSARRELTHTSTELATPPITDTTPKSAEESPRDPQPPVRTEPTP